jgi:hypothetical protein
METNEEELEETFLALLQMVFLTVPEDQLGRVFLGAYWIHCTKNSTRASNRTQEDFAKWW